MKSVEFWIWKLHKPGSLERVQTSFRLTEAEALRRDAHAERVPGTLEVRVLPKHPDEYLSRLVFERSAQAGSARAH